MTIHEGDNLHQPDLDLFVGSVGNIGIQRGNRLLKIGLRCAPEQIGMRRLHPVKQHMKVITPRGLGSITLDNRAILCRGKRHRPQNDE